jgi:hypothetical protein
VANVPNATEHTAQAALNSLASPDYYIYKGMLTPEEVGSKIQLDDVGNMTVGDVDKLNAFFRLRPGGFNASDVNDRSGFNNVLSAAAADDSQQALIVLWRRLATNYENLFATGNGAIGTPSTAVLIGPISLDDTINAMNRP